MTRLGPGREQPNPSRRSRPPACRSRLVGRSAELADVVRRLADPDMRLLTITGHAGAGKTALAMEVARTVAEVDPDRVAVVELAQVRDGDGLVPALSDALGAPAGFEGGTVESIGRLLVPGPTLLVLDNFEQMLDAATTVAALLDDTPSLQVLVTSQSPLRVAGEHLLRLGPLHPEDAILLFEQRADALRVASSEPPDPEAVAALCACLEGLPLAVELAASRTTTLSAAELLRRMSDDDGLGVLAHGSRDAPERHQSLRAAIGVSYRLLPADRAALLRWLAQFEGAFDLEATEWMGVRLGQREDTVLDELSELVDIGVVELIRQSGRDAYRLPPTIRAFVRELELEDREGADRALDEWCCELGRQARNRLESPDEHRWIQRLSDGLEDLQVTLQRLLARGEAADAIDLALAIAPVWRRRGRNPAGARMLQSVVELADQPEVEAGRRAELLAWSGYLHERGPTGASRDGHDQAARAALESAPTSDVIGRLRTLSLTILVMAQSGDFDAVAEMATDGMRLAKGDELWLGRFETWSAMLSHQKGNDVDAAALGASGLTRAQRAGDRTTELRATLLLTSMRDKVSGVTIPSLDEALELARHVGDAEAEAFVLPALVVRSVQRQEVGEAVQYAAMALRLAVQTGSWSGAALALMVAVSAAYAHGDERTAAGTAGTLSSALPMLLANIAPEDATSYELTVASIRRRLGETDFKRLFEGGRRQSWDDALVHALAWADATATDLSAREAPTEETLTRSPEELVTPRELEVLRLLAEGLSNKDIARHLGLTPKTVMHHAASLYRKLDVRGRAEATAWAFRNGVMTS